MKKMYVLFYPVLIVCMISCANKSSDAGEPVSTVPAPSAVPATPPVQRTPPAEIKKDRVQVKDKDTARTNISFGQHGASVKTKKGTGVSVNDNGVKVGTKDVNIDFQKN